MKYILMLLFGTLWLYSQACSHVGCSHTIVVAETTLHSESNEANELFHQFLEAVQNRVSSNPLDIVVIDPGHGGKDKGCSGSSSNEKEITLKISKQLRVLINEKLPEVKVLLTREEDHFIPLQQRAKFANTNQADIFISVHCNYLRNAPKFRGSETFVLGIDSEDSAAEQLAMRENESIFYENSYESTYEGFDPNSLESYIMFSMIQNMYLDKSIVLAQLVDDELQNTTTVPSQGVKQGAFVVLKETTMPSILVETGYLSNSEDERLLTNPAGQKSVARALLSAIQAYKLSND